MILETVKLNQKTAPKPPETVLPKLEGVLSKTELKRAVVHLHHFEMQRNLLVQNSVEILHENAHKVMVLDIFRLGW